MFNYRSKVLARSGTTFDYEERRSVGETGQILEILQQGADRGDQSLEEAMRAAEEERGDSPTG